MPRRRNRTPTIPQVREALERFEEQKRTPSVEAVRDALARFDQNQTETRPSNVNRLRLFSDTANRGKWFGYLHLLGQKYILRGINTTSSTGRRYINAIVNLVHTEEPSS